MRTVTSHRVENLNDGAPESPTTSPPDNIEVDASNGTGGANQEGRATAETNKKSKYVMIELVVDNKNATMMLPVLTSSRYIPLPTNLLYRVPMMTRELSFSAEALRHVWGMIYR